MQLQGLEQVWKRLQASFLQGTAPIPGRLPDWQEAEGEEDQQGSY